MSTSSGARAIVAALAANLGIAVAKFVAFLLTRSSAMLAESIHSVADSGNQVLLLVGGRRARRAATPAHPFGYGRERYVYGFLVSIVLFSLGGLFALYEGWHKLVEATGATGHGGLASPAWAVGVLVIALGLEGFSLRTAVTEARPLRAGSSWLQFVRRAKAPELPVVLLEDFGALIGLCLALLGVGLSILTGSAVWDAAGTLAIGTLLLVIAVLLGVETKSLLLGEGATPANVEQIDAALRAEPGVDQIIHMRTLHLGPDELLVAAKIAVSGGMSAAELAAVIDGAERRIRAAVPIARVIYLEPDLLRPAASSEAG